MKILLLGKNGQVGWELQRALSVLGEVVALDRHPASTPYGELKGDLSDLDSLRAAIIAVSPQVIVNAAAYTAVDKAESERETAHIVNALASQVMAEEAKRLGAWLVHYSTDYVFDGTGTTPWRETDSVAPVNYYGATKLEGEQLIQASGCKHLISAPAGCTLREVTTSPRRWCGWPKNVQRSMSSRIRSVFPRSRSARRCGRFGAAAGVAQPGSGWGLPPSSVGRNNMACLRQLCY